MTRQGDTKTVAGDAPTGERPREYPSVKASLRKLILASLSAPYMSRSCQDDIKTTNHYQSIDLGDTVTSGFRTTRHDILDRIRFKGRKVLDLGSNLGELSRAARVRGARLVDGYEYDPYFIEVANLINAHRDMSRVSFYQRDITSKDSFAEHFDTVLAFSVFVYIQPRIADLARITDRLLVLETHKLDGNLNTTYLRPLLPHFPYYRKLGESEWGSSRQASDRRAVIAFAKDKTMLDMDIRGHSKGSLP